MGAAQQDSHANETHASEPTFIDVRVRLHVDREQAAFGGLDDVDHSSGEGERMHTFRCPRSLTTAQLRRIIREKLLDGHNCRLQVQSEEADAASGASASTLASTSSSSLPQSLPDSSLLSSMWPPSHRTLSLHIPPFWPLTSETVVVAVVAASPLPLSERQPRYSIHLSVDDLRTARVANLANQVQLFMHLDEAVTVDLLDAHGNRLPPATFVATLIPRSQELRLYFECNKWLTPDAFRAAMNLPFVMDPSDMNLPLSKPRAPLTSEAVVEPPVRAVTHSMSGLLPSLSLPTALAASILAFLPFRARLSILSRVNREWHQLAYSPLVWSVADTRSWYIETRAQFKDPHDAPLFFNRSAAAVAGACLTFEPPSLTLEEAGIHDGSTVDVHLDHALF